jgi:carboxyl-terminal processing protease
MTIILFLSACTTSIGLPPLGWFPVTLDNTKLHQEVFAQANRRLVTYHVEAASLQKQVPQALEALRQLAPSFAPQLSKTPAAQDWNGWADLTYAAITADPELAKLPPEQIYQTFFPALLGNLDGFSHYLPPEEAEAQEEWRTGYGGIGVTFERRGTDFIIVDVFIASPAALAGLRAGERVLAVDGQAVATLSAKEFADRVRGPIGTPITLTVARRDGATRNVIVNRARVLPTTVALNISDNIAWLRISRFMPSTVHEFRNAARQIARSGTKAVVLDLQHNPGGVLEQATEVAALLVPRGLVAVTKGRHPDAYQEYRAGGADILNGLPLLVLVDGHTASAAETLTAALQDRGRATIIGSNTYGKGTVQNVGPLPHGGELAVTWSRLYAPSGYSYAKVGIMPDVCVLNTSPCPRADDVEALAVPIAREMALKSALPVLAR